MLESLSVDLITNLSKTFCHCENCDFESGDIERAARHAFESHHVVFERTETVIEKRISVAADTVNLIPKTKKKRR